MAKGIYVGINNIARKVNKVYLGVGGAVRKVIKAYVGVGGIARLFFTTELSYIGTLAPLGGKRSGIVAGSNAKYAMFMGGVYSGIYTNTYAYDSNLSRVDSPYVSNPDNRSNYCGGYIGDYIWWSTVVDQVTYNSYLSAFDLSLVRTIVKGIAYQGIVETYVINTPYYSYVRVGAYSDSVYTVQTISPSLVKATIPRITPNPGHTGKRGTMLASAGDVYIIAAGGQGTGGTGNSVNFVQTAVAWNAQTTAAYGQISSLVAARSGGVGFGNSKMAILAGGNVFNGYDGSLASNIIDAYDVNLVHYSSSLPSTGPAYIMGGGTVSPVVSTPDKGYLFYYNQYLSFDTNLVMGYFSPASIHRVLGAATTFQGDKILYGGGNTANLQSSFNQYDTVDLYRY